MRWSRFNRIYKYGLPYGLSQAGVLLSYGRCSRLYFTCLSLKEKAMLSFLHKRYGYVIDKYKNKNVTETNPIKFDDNIWIFWHSGIDNMPDIVRACYNSVLQNAENYKVQLLTDENLENFIDIPYYILKKKEQGLISIQHFSDYVRMAVLSRYGGIWMDATVLLTSPIKLVTPSYFISIKNYDLKYVPNRGKWNIFFIGGGKGNILFAFMTEMLSEYWKKHNDIIDYFYTDYCINVAYNEIAGIKEMIDSLPRLSSECDVHSLLHVRNMPVNEKIYSNIVEHINIHKLQYKSTELITSNGEQSFAGYVVEKYL